MDEKPRDIYQSREPSRSVVEEHKAGDSEGQWFQSIAHNRWSTVLVVLFLLGFAGVLVGVILYQQRMLKNSRQQAEAAKPPIELSAPVRTGMDIDIDASNRLVLDEIEAPLNPDELRGGVPDRLTPAWVKQAAFCLRQGERAYAEQNWQAALAEYSAALKILPSIVTAREMIGLCRLRLREYAEAEKIFSEACARQTNSPALLNNLGVALLGQDKFDAAERTLREAITLDPDYHPARQNIALLYYRSGRAPQATEALESLVRVDPQNVETLLMLSAMQMKMERWPDAAETLAEVSRINPRIPLVFFRMAEARARGGDTKGAITALESGFRLIDARTALALLNRPNFDILRNRPEFQQKLRELSEPKM